MFTNNSKIWLFHRIYWQRGMTGFKNKTSLIFYHSLKIAINDNRTINNICRPQIYIHFKINCLFSKERNLTFRSSDNPWTEIRFYYFSFIFFVISMIKLRFSWIYTSYADKPRIVKMKSNYSQCLLNIYRYIYKFNNDFYFKWNNRRKIIAYGRPFRIRYK